MSNFYICGICERNSPNKNRVCTSSLFPIAAVDHGPYYEYVDGLGKTHATPISACPHFREREWTQ